MVDATMRVTKRRADTRQRLLDAAAEVFTEHGFDAPSVEVIAERAGFTRGAFYSNFSSKEELLAELATSIENAHLEAVRERVEELKSAGIRDLSVTVIISHTIDAITQMQGAIGLMNEFRTRALRDQDTATSYTEWADGMERGIAAVIDDLAEASGRTLSLSSREVARMMMFICDGSAIQGLIERKSEDAINEAIRTRTTAFVEALVLPNAQPTASA